MKKNFPGFYSPTNEQIKDAWKSESTLFVFDTNTLLNLYSYEKQTRDDFFSILDVLSDRIWVPYHVGIEYQRRRLGVVRDEKAVFRNIEEKLAKIETILANDFQTLRLKQRFPKLHENTIRLESNIKSKLAAYRKSLNYWDEKQPCVRGHDEIRERLDQLFEDKVGPIPTQDELNAIYKNGEERYKLKMPPGYKDSAKSNNPDEARFEYGGLVYERMFGDLIIWKQILNKAKEENIKSIIFVTDENKEDWWYILNSRGDKTIGARAELREEIKVEAGIDIFNIYNTSGFLKDGEILLEVDVDDQSINDADRSFNDAAHASLNLGIAALLPEFNKDYLQQLLANDSLKYLKDSISMSTGLAELAKTLTEDYEAKMELQRKIDYQKALSNALRGWSVEPRRKNLDSENDAQADTGDEE